jgi:hypothetical protein
MTDLPINEDEDWNYLSGILGASNNDEDLVETESVNEIKTKESRTPLEAEIQNRISPMA